MRHRRLAVAIAVLSALLVAALLGCDQLFGITVRAQEPADAATDVTTAGDSGPVTDSAQGADARDGAAPDAPKEGGGGDAGDGAVGDGSDGALGDGSDGALGDVGGEDADGSDGSDSAQGPCTVVYVSAMKGNDANSGCSEGSPKATLAAGFAAAQAAGAGAVHVCSGTYDENGLTLQGSSLSISGGFDCTSWVALPGPSDGGLGSTIVQNTSASPSTAATLTLSGSSSVVEGLTIYGPTAPPDGGMATYAAVDVTATSTATLLNDYIVGGGGPAQSTGVTVQLAASATIMGSFVGGGSGAPPTTPNGSIGVFAPASSGSIVLLGNAIHGGSGVSPIYNGSSFGGTGQASANCSSCYASRGLYITGEESVVFQDNVVQPTEPGMAVTTGEQCPWTTWIEASGTVYFTGNRVYAGECAEASPHGTDHEGANFGPGPNNGPTFALIENNLIHGGKVDGNHGGFALVVDTPNTIIRNNTLVAPQNFSSNGYSLWLQTSAKGAYVEGNILAGVDGRSIALVVDCTANLLVPTTLVNNLMFASFALYHTSGCTSASAYTVVDTEAVIRGSGGIASGNIAVSAPPCPVRDGGAMDPGCIPACTGTSCAETLFAGWDTPSLGAANLLGVPAFDGGCPSLGSPSGDGWPLVTSGAVPCGVLRIGTPSDAGASDARASDAGAGLEVGPPPDAGPVSVDFFGNCRGPMPTMGAIEAPPSASCR